MAVDAAPRLLHPDSTAAVLFGASDWRETGLGRAPSFLRSATDVFSYLIGGEGLGLDPGMVLDLFDDRAPAGEQLAHLLDWLSELRLERRDAGRPIKDVLVYYVGHGSTDDAGHLALLVRHSRRGVEAETGIKAPDLAGVLRRSAPQQRRMVVLDCCFSEAAARAFIGMGALDQAVAAAAAKDIADPMPTRGGLLLCSSPVGDISVGPPDAKRTLFTGAVLDVLRGGAAGCAGALSFADLREAAHGRMVEEFGAKAPRPVLHAVNQAQGDLTRLPAFPNRAVGAATNKPAQETFFPGEEAPSYILASLPQPDRTAQKPPPTVSITRTSEQTQATSANSETVGTSLRTPEKTKSRGVWPVVAAGAAAPLAVIVVAGLVAANNAKHQYVSSISSPANTAARPPSQPAAPSAPPAALSVAAQSPPASSTGPEKYPHEIFADGQSYERAGDYDEAARRYGQAAEHGNAEAQFRLGVFHEQGWGVLMPDEREAARLFQHAANQGHAWAQLALGLYHQQGRGGLKYDLDEATHLYQQAARAGNTAAQALLRELGRGW